MAAQNPTNFLRNARAATAAAKKSGGELKTRSGTKSSKSGSGGLLGSKGKKGGGRRK